MTNDLNDLAKRMPPKASEVARRRALAAAMDAFDASEEFSNAAQGSPARRRQSSILNRLWSPLMNRRFLAGSALATLLVVPAAGYLTFQLTRNGLPVQTSVSESKVVKTEESVSIPVEDLPKVDTSTLESDAARPAPVDRQSETRRETDFSAGEVAQLFNRPEASGGEAKRSSSSERAYATAKARSSEATERQRNQGVFASKPMRMDQAAVAAPEPLSAVEQDSRDRFSGAETNPVKSVASDPVSTFSADVDTASYSFARKSLMAGQLPDRDSVRVEEMVNYFPYDWPGPQSSDTPFQATVTVTPTPWNAHTRLMHIGIKGYDVAPAVQPRANLVFLIDVSGSMEEPDKLPLLKNAFRLLVEKLKPEDTVAIVTYAGSAGTVLEPTAVKDKAKILSAIDNLQSGGSTAGAEGIEAAYALAERVFVKDGVNRVMLATDGDFNVGPSSDDALKAMIEAKRKNGIFLSVLGFGRGNYNDALMQTLAQNGNGTASYIDTLAEAQKSLVEEAGSSLFPIAKDVKFQVEFNPQQVAEYRLIGYETRALKREDFNNDRVDAGDIGSGHRVTAIYEVTPKGSPAILNDDLRYAQAPTGKAETAPADRNGELAFLKSRYKRPDSDTSRLITTPVTEANAVSSLDAAPQDVRFSIAVAAFGQKLRGTDALSTYPYGSIVDLASKARGDDPYGYRAEFLNLVRLAKGLSGE